jgi:ribosomal protein S4E
MSEIHQITEVKTLNGKNIFLKFSDGKSGTFNFEDFFSYKGILAPLKDEEVFKKVMIVDGTISWPNECDFNPDVLYSIITNEKIYVDGELVFDPLLKKDAWLHKT